MSSKRPAVLLALVGAVLAVLRRRKAARTDKDLWNEATSAPDLR